jgi:exodeoxyribonuclease V beta subunit
LNWLVAGKGIAVDDWDAGKTPLETIDSQWQALSVRAGGNIDLLPLEAVTSASAIATTDAPPAYAARELARTLPLASWRLESYSSLLRRHSGEFALVDHDAVAPAAGAEAGEVAAFPRSVPDSVGVDDILRFPRGARAGECLHALFEYADLTRPAGWADTTGRCLRRHADVGGDDVDGERARLLKLLADVVATPLPGGWRLGTIAPAQRLVELEFYFPVDRLRLSQVFDLLERHGWSGRRVDAGRLQGYLRGSIDFVCRHNERWYVIDWKSNHLGYQAEDYRAERIAAEMREAHYDLQALIYLIALHRYLRLRLGESYRVAEHLGGALYLFVRGVRPAWPGAGIWHWQPDATLIDELDALFGEPVEAT